MDAPDVEHPFLFAHPKIDEVGLCGFNINKNLSFDDDAMRSTIALMEPFR